MFQYLLPSGRGGYKYRPQHILNNLKECAGTPPNKNSISIYGSFLKLFAKKSLLRAVTAGLLCPAGPRTQESSHTGWSVPTEWFPVHPPFCFNPSDWGGALSSFLLSSLLSLISISFQKCIDLSVFIPRKVITSDEVWKTPLTFFNDIGRNSKGRLCTVFTLVIEAKGYALGTVVISRDS